MKNENRKECFVLFFGLIATFASAGGFAGPILALIAFFCSGCAHQYDITPTVSECRKFYLIGVAGTDDVIVVVGGSATPTRRAVYPSTDPTMKQFGARGVCVPQNTDVRFEIKAYVRSLDACKTPNAFMVLISEDHRGVFQRAPIALVSREEKGEFICEVHTFTSQ